jgi:hypothetical protein
LFLKEGTTTDSAIGMMLTTKNAKKHIAINEVSKSGEMKTAQTETAETTEAIPITDGPPILLDRLNQKGFAIIERVGVTAIRIPISIDEKPLL